MLKEEKNIIKTVICLYTFNSYVGYIKLSIIKLNIINDKLRITGSYTERESMKITNELFPYLVKAWKEERSAIEQYICGYVGRRTGRAFLEIMNKYYN